MTNNKINNTQPDDRRWACPGLFRMPMSGDGGICRIKLELGKINADQLRALAQLVNDYGDGQLEVTTRGNVQIRGVAEPDAHILSQKLIAAGFGPRVKNGDDVRNVMVNPTAGIDKFALSDITPFAEELSLHVQQHYQKLSPKFSFLIDGGESCAVLDHQSDIWLSLCDDGNNFVFGLASCPVTQLSSGTALGKVAYDQAHTLVYALLNLLLTKQKLAPNIQRMKHLVKIVNKDEIIDWLKSCAIHVQSADNFVRQTIETHYLGIHETNQKDRFYLGVKAPFARLSPIKLFLLAQTLDQYNENAELRFTPWQSIIFPNCSHEDAQFIKAVLARQDFIVSDHDTRAKILCCAGAPKCAKAKSNTLTDAASLAASLESCSIDKVHLTGCSKSCAATKAQSTTLVAKAQGIYDLYNKVQGVSSDHLADDRFGQLVGKNLNLGEVALILRKKSLASA